ncbi:tyrosine-type recombinase/integrase [Sphingorhabdus soli]|uniref:Tyrosine-type recombinase/integrase n=1 Tax=Flavisphingopyxis soli TaxID=2601267 RepID=A0A5C6UT30_9SPHN|nr:site-specific integrase [Sphingorhabdus soli]TXC74068.1 tyrosine-type recombinase/integrase [Sphingorhabdus soli]
MTLTDTTIRNAKPGPKARKLGDGGGLYLLVQPGGSKLWRLKYVFADKEKKPTLCRYPEVSLKEARRRRDEARTALALGRNPADDKKRAQLEAGQAIANTFAKVAEEFLEKSSLEGRAAVTIKKSQWLISLLLPKIGNRPIAEITPAELLAAIKVVHDRGHYETARRMRSLSGRVFRLAIMSSRASNDPSSYLQGALVTPRIKHHAAIIEPEKVGGLLRAIDGFEGQPLTRLALQLTPHVFVRPGELRRAEWSEFDFAKARWTIPAPKMKMRQAHIVPLSKQAIEILKSAEVLSAGQQYVFSSMYPGTRPMSENTINAALRRLGYSGDEMTAHGFRAMASSLLNESGLWSSDAIELALAHDNSSSVRGNYHRGQHMDERTRMAQWWSDYLDELRSQMPGVD